MQKTIAAIDIGTNSAHLVIAEVDEHEHIHVIDTDKITIRLGSQIGPDGGLTEEGIQKTVHALLQMREICQSYTTHIRVVATHAMREAKNHHHVIELVHEQTGMSIEIIDGLEEARLIYLGISHGLPLTSGRTLAMDIGGGSTEIILSEGESFSYLTSLKLGAVTLTDKLKGKAVLGTSPGATAESKLVDFINLRLAPLRHELHRLRHDVAVFSSGTAKAIMTIYYRRLLGEKIDDFNGRELPGDAVRKITSQLLALGSIEKIERYTGLSPSRSEIILAGAIILDQVTELLNVKSWVYSDFALREGLVIDTHRRMTGRTTSGENSAFRWTRLKSLGQRMQIDEIHAAAVMGVGLDVLTQIWPLLTLPPETKEAMSWFELFQGAAHLHEIGKIISFPKFHLHSEYILQHSQVLGFTQDERRIMGLIIRFHRKGMKVKPGDALLEYPLNLRRAILALSAALRFASAACRLRENRVKSINIDKKDKKIIFLLKSGPDAHLTIELKKMYDDREIYESSWGVPIEFYEES